jgi:hypothetical protein
MTGAYVIRSAESRPRPVVPGERIGPPPSVTVADVALVCALRARLAPRPDVPVHICEPFDGTRTLCGQPAGCRAAIDFASHGYARGPFCLSCEVGYLRACMEDAAGDLDRREDGASTPYHVAKKLRRDARKRPST